MRAWFATVVCALASNRFNATDCRSFSLAISTPPMAFLGASFLNAVTASFSTAIVTHKIYISQKKNEEEKNLKEIEREKGKLTFYFFLFAVARTYILSLITSPYFMTHHRDYIRRGSLAVYNGETRKIWDAMVWLLCTCKKLHMVKKMKPSNLTHFHTLERLRLICYLLIFSSACVDEFIQLKKISPICSVLSTYGLITSAFDFLDCGWNQVFALFF